MKKLLQTLNNRKGFTLIEIIVGVAILTVLLAVGVSAIAGYAVSSEMTYLNQTAKTLYLAAQDYLTQATAGGALEEINASAVKVNLSSVKPEPTDATVDNKDNIVYLSLARSGSGVGGDTLRRILEQFVGDKPMLEQSILLEYNKTTGVVLSVLYSERASELSYSGADTDSTSVNDRNSEPLRQKRQGYYGVVYTGRLGEKFKLDDPNVEIVNGDRLYVKWKDITPSGGLNSLAYKLTIYSEDWQTEYLSVYGIPNIVQQTIAYPTSFEQAEPAEKQITGLETYFNGLPMTGDQQNHRIVRLDSENLAFVLDDIHASIFDKYPSIPVGNIHATVEPVIDWIQSTVGVTQVPGHSYFAKETTEASVGEAPPKIVYSIQNARQLNNMRHAAPDSNYVQLDSGSKTGFLDWTTPEQGDATQRPIDYEVTTFYYRKTPWLPDQDIKEFSDEFTGTYNGQGNSIINLNVVPVHAFPSDVAAIPDMTSNIGWFSKLQDATIQNCALLDFSLKLDSKAAAGWSQVGAFAGSAVGSTLNFCSVGVINKSSEIYVPLVKDAGQIGGLLGYAETCSISNSSNEARVQAGTSAELANGRVRVPDGKTSTGGIAGVIKGGTLVRCSNMATVLGGSETGGIVGLLDGGTIDSCAFSTNVEFVAGQNNVGGIVGLNQNGKILKCLIDNMSGITDSNSGEMRDAMFTNALTALNNHGGTFADYSGSFPAVSTAGVYGSNNVGGIVGLNHGSVESFNGGNGKVMQEVWGSDNVGGIIGCNETDGTALWESTSNRADGLVVGSGSNVGGIFGSNLNKAVKLEGLKNNAHVIASRFAGGIIGTNGVRAAGNDAAVMGAIISDCNSDGVVYAYTEYAGGIAGCNTGTIESCTINYENAQTLDDAIKELTNLTYGDYVGGITGYNNGQITSCNSGGLVKGKNYVGGITGHNEGSGWIYDCKTTGGRIVALEDFAGGFIGRNSTDQLSGSSENSVSAMGSMLSTAALVEGRRFVGGIIGCNESLTGELYLQASNGNAKDNGALVKGEAFVGGIIGYNSSSLNSLPENPYGEFAESDSGSSGRGIAYLSSCYNYGEVQGARYVGGIVGYNSVNNSLTAANCRNEGAISFNEDKADAAGLEQVKANGFYYIGSITGRNTSTGLIWSCLNNGTVKNNSRFSGGLVEVNEGVILDCINYGSIIKDGDHVGGVAGLNRTVQEVRVTFQGHNPPYDASDFNKATIQNCTSSTGVIQGKSFVGGIVADNHARVINCSYTGETKYGSNFTLIASGDCVGGIAGYNGWDGELIETRKVKNSISGADKDSDFDAKGGSIKGRYLVGGIVGYDESQYPREGLINNARVVGEYYVGGIAGGYGKSLDSNAPDAKVIFADCYNLENGWVVALTTASKAPGATFEVKGFVSWDDAGLPVLSGTKKFSFDSAGVGGIIGTALEQVSIEECENRGSVAGKIPAGGIVGYNRGSIRGSVNSGTVIGTTQASKLASSNASFSAINREGDYVGGIAGINEVGGKLDACTAEKRFALTDEKPTAGEENAISCMVEGRSAVGGLVGCSRGVITDSTVQEIKVSVRGIGNVGGLVGQLENGDLSYSDQNQALKNVTVTVHGDTYSSDSVAKLPSGLQYSSVGGIIGANLSTGGGQKVISGYTFSGVVDYLKTLEAKGDANKIPRNCQYIGGIVGMNQEGYAVLDCSVSGKVSGNTANSETSKEDIFAGVGGMAGYNAGTLERCNLLKEAVISGTNHIGGLIGFNDTTGELYQSANGSDTIAPKIVGTEYAVGGYIGYNKSPSALVRTRSLPAGEKASQFEGAKEVLVNYASVTGYSLIGGIVGDNAGIVTCTGVGAVGGITGRVHNPNLSELKVSGCLNRAEGKVLVESSSADSQYLGGVIGSANAVSDSRTITLDKCENLGLVQGKAQYCAYIGGVAGTLQTGTKALECVNKGTVYDTANSNSGVGGIVGYLNNGAVESSENYGAVRFDKESKGIRLGGIAGFMENGSINLSTNKAQAVISTSKENYNGSNGIGGIVGYSKLQYKTEKTGIYACVNEAEISFPAANFVGGIVGRGDGSVIDNCTNAEIATVKGNEKVGGILGGAQYFWMGDKPLVVSINSCKNSAQIIGSKVGGMLGFVDATEAAFKIADCTNDGEIILIPGSGGGAGGILGRDTMSQYENEIVNCSNTGRIRGGVSTADSAEGLGGIAGRLEKNTTVSSCWNSGDITDLYSETGNYAFRIGGIAGDVSEKSQIRFCTNYGAISTTQLDPMWNHGQFVGGIAGHNKGSIVSSQNMGEVYGHTNVGGIVGYNDGKEALIYSLLDVTIGDSRFTRNEMPVEGYLDVGGIAGKNAGGGIVATYNNAGIKGAQHVGGLIGSATMKKEDGSVGSLANSFSVPLSLPELTSDSQFRGGIIGMRVAAYDSVNSHNIKTAFYRAEQPASTILAVGNEPAAEGILPGQPGHTIGVNDSPQESALSDRRLSESFFEKYGLKVDWTNPADILSKIREFLDKKPYTLDQPMNVHTVSNKEYEYTTSWDMVQGLVGGYEVRLRPIGMGDDEKSDIVVGSVYEIDPDGRLKTYLSFDVQSLVSSGAFPNTTSINDIVGKEYDVVVVTKGIIFPSGGGSKDSEKHVSEEKRKILPVLPKPGATEGNPIKATALLNKHYQVNIPPQDYTLRSVRDEKYPHLDLTSSGFYAEDQKYENALKGFDVYQIKDDEKLEKVNAASWEGLYQYVMDHSAETQNPKFRFYIQAMSKDQQNAFAHSGYGYVEYKVQIKLPPPVELSSTFSGTQEQPKYTLKWKEVEHSRGYTIGVSYRVVDESSPDGFRDVHEELTRTTGSKGVTVSWDVSSIEFFNSEVQFYVIADGDDADPPLPENDIIYLTSDPSELYTFHVPMNLSPPLLEVKPDEDNDNAATILWEPQDSLILIDHYILTAFQIDNLTGEEKPYAIDAGSNTARPGSGETSRDHVFAEADFGCYYIFRIKAVGKLGQSMDSKESEIEFFLPPRLPTPSMLTLGASGEIPSSDEEKMTKCLEWDQKQNDGLAFAQEQLEGTFSVKFMRNGREVSLPFQPGMSNEYGFMEQDPTFFVPGGVYAVSLVADAVPGKYSKSLPSSPMALQLPARMQKPEGLNVELSPESNPPMREYGEAEHRITWTPYAGDALSLILPVNSFELHVETAGETGMEDITDQLTFTPPIVQLKNDSREIAFNAPLQFAGKTIKVTLKARGGHATLDSEFVELTDIQLPKAQFEAPIPSVNPTAVNLEYDDETTKITIGFSADEELYGMLTEHRDSIEYLRIAIGGTCKTEEDEKDFTIRIDNIAPDRLFGASELGSYSISVKDLEALVSPEMYGKIKSFSGLKAAVQIQAKPESGFTDSEPLAVKNVTLGASSGLTLGGSRTLGASGRESSRGDEEDGYTVGSLGDGKAYIYLQPVSRSGIRTVMDSVFRSVLPVYQLTSLLRFLS